MSLKARSWLPDAALTDGRLAEAVGQAVAAWASEWIARFSDPVVQTGSKPGALAQRDIWTTADTAVELGLDRDSRRALGAALLDLQGEALSEIDFTVIDKVSARAAQELLTRISQQLLGQTRQVTHRTGLPRPEADDAVTLTVEMFEPSMTVSVQLSADAAVQARKALAPAKKQKLRPVPLSDAIAETKLCVGARLGGAELTLAQANELAPGDVIVLDRSYGDPLDLMINQTAAPHLSCTLNPSAEPLSLTVRAPSYFERSNRDRH